MPVIIPSSSGGSSAGATYTAQDIINGASQDLRSQIPTTSTILLDYTDRIHKEIIRSSRWSFMLAGTQQFITRPGVTDYWIGATGSNPQGSVDTGLNLPDIYRLKEDSVLDRSNNQQLYRTEYTPPNLTTFEFPDGQSRQLRPTNFNHLNYSSLLRLFPAPNNQNGYQPSPESPICSITSGGALPLRTYSVKYTIVDSTGAESSASANATPIVVPANFLLVVNSPVFPIPSAVGVGYSQYKVYASTVVGNECVQNSNTAITSGSNFTEPTSGLVTTTSLAPTLNSLTKMNGYLIEFRYYRQRLKILSAATTLLIPDDYKDILIAGVNWLGYMYLKMPTDAKMWFQQYENGIREMIRDRNQFGVGEFMQPDNITQIFPSGGVPGFITS